MRATDQRKASLEQDARQPHLAMEADGPANTMTLEHKEGAATAVQAMHGDSFSARRVDPGPNTTSTSFGMNTEPPALPCRDDVVVEDRAAGSKSCLPSLEMRSPTAAGGLLPTGEISTATKITFNKSPLRPYSTEEAIRKRQINGLQLHPPGLKTAVPGEINCLLPPPTGGSLRQNRGKIGRLIQAVLKVVSAPARFWESGARCFVVRLCVLERLGEAAACFGGEWYGRNYLRRTYSGQFDGS